MIQLRIVQSNLMTGKKLKSINSLFYNDHINHFYLWQENSNFYKDMILLINI